MNDATPYSYCKMPGANVNGILACEVIAEMHADPDWNRKKFKAKHPSDLNWEIFVKIHLE
ncbi:MAG: hypothetical protein JNIBNLAF_01524 [Nitrosomonas europaea]|uniref:hypothetical protein n=1 Tax=Nitrosomonas europaea TaxID=915 RepID=UPI0023F22D44|nr:hypothetical protein [Nitrosomonas europaea]MBV6389873.1 hypothetical protein [Nitrosomonas europaea]